MIQLLIALVIIVVGCTDAPTGVGIQPVGEATLLWSIRQNDGSWYNVSPDGRFVFRMNRTYSDNVEKFDATSGALLPDALLIGQNAAFLSPDGTMVACTRLGAVTVYRLSDGAQLAMKEFEHEIYGSIEIFCCWDLNNTTLYVWSLHHNPQGLHVISNVSSNGPMRSVGNITDNTYEEAFYGMGPLPNPNKIRLTPRLVYDAALDRIVSGPFSIYTLSLPHRNGEDWYVIDGDTLVTLDASGNEISITPLHISRTYVSATVSNFAISRTGRYGAFHVYIDDFEDGSELWIIDLQDGSHRCHIKLEDGGIPYSQITFDPLDDRVVYIQHHPTLTKWRFK